ncbi:MAG: PilZ domain-containing protein [Pseudobdellovibrio sp.]
MSGSLARYHARSPRYTLDTQDNSLIRFSGAERFTWEEKTDLRNISLTGLSFTAPADLSPQLGEIIKIQFSVPGSQTMACYAIVIRSSSLDDYNNEIAVHFYKLDRTQRINLVQGLAQKMDTDKLDSKNSTDSRKRSLRDHFLYLPLMLLALISWLVIIQHVFLK